MQFAKEVNEVNSQRKQPVAKLYNVEPALTAFDLADQCLIAS